MLSNPYEMEALVALRQERWEQEIARRRCVHGVVFGPPWWRKRLGGMLQTIGAVLVWMGERLAVDEGRYG